MEQMDSVDLIVQDFYADLVNLVSLSPLEALVASLALDTGPQYAWSLIWLPL